MKVGAAKKLRGLLSQGYVSDIIFLEVVAA